MDKKSEDVGWMSKTIEKILREIESGMVNVITVE